MMKKSVLTSKPPGFFNSRNPFVQQNQGPKKEPMISNSTSPFRPRSSKENEPRKSVNSPYKMTLNTGKLKFQNELSIIFKEFLRTEGQKNSDPSKWRKKFKFLMDREKLFNFDAIEGSQIFAKKGIMTTLEPKVAKKGYG